MPNNELLIKIKADTKKAVEEIEKLKGEIKEFAKEVQTGDVSLQKSEASLAKFTKRLTQLATAYMSFQAVKGAIGVVADFEQSIAKLGAISGASKDKLEALKQKAEELGKSTMFSASEVAEGMNYLAMAGYKTKDILASIGDVLNLAAIGQTSLAEASDIASNILSGFNLKASETTRVVDVMTATITNANTNIPELGEAMKYVAPQARALGVSLEETAAAIGVLSNAGIKASMAGTGLSTMLLRLSAPTGRAADAIKELGIKLFDANGKFVGLKNALLQFKEKLKGASQEIKAQYLTDIFGIETMKTALTLIDSVDSGYDKLLAKIQKSTGLTKEKVKQMTDTFKMHLKELQSAFEGLLIVVGNDLLPALTKFVEWLTKATADVSNFYKENKELIKVIGELAAALYAVGKTKAVIEAILGAQAVARIVAATKAVGSLKEAFLLLGGAIAKLAKTNALLLALTAAITGVSYALDEWEGRIERLDEATKKVNQSTDDFKKLVADLQAKMDGGKHIKATAEELEKLKERTKEMIRLNARRIQQLSRLYEKGTSDNAALKRQIDELAHRNEILLKIYDKLEHTKPHEGAKKSAQEAANGVRLLTKEERKLQQELKKAQQKEIQGFVRTYRRRLAQHSATIERLRAKEVELNNKIIALKQALVNRLKEIERQRLNAIEDIENKIHNLQLAGASEYERFVDKKRQAEERFAKAKEAIARGDLAQAKRYMSQYEALLSSIANTEIKEGKKVILSKQQAAKVAIAGYQKLKALVNGYYALEKQKAIEAHNQKIRQLQAQLQATKAQLQLELQRLSLEKQMIELLTGKKVSIDTSGALQAIRQLDS